MSARDEAVLEAIINPSLPLIQSKPVEQEDSFFIDNTDHCRHETDFGSNTASSRANDEEISSAELDAVRGAEAGHLSRSLQLLNDLVQQHPDRASVFNNRAQVYRLLQRNEEAMCDVDRAVHLSAGMGGVAGQALCQRAQLHKLNGQHAAAARDLAAAATLGSKFAKNQLVSLNPYAALCNNMLAQVMHKLQQGTYRHE